VAFEYGLLTRSDAHEPMTRVTWMVALLCVSACSTTLDGGDCDDVCSGVAAARATLSTTALMSTEQSDDGLIEKTTCFCPELYDRAFEQDAGTDGGPLSDGGPRSTE
jgi:hypothetical protein